jgi:hypothetical protein
MDTAPVARFTAVRQSAPRADERRLGLPFRRLAKRWHRSSLAGACRQGRARSQGEPEQQSRNMGEFMTHARAVIAAAALAALLCPGIAGATAQRTFVASTGTDANPCTLPAPCRSFVAAIALTNAGGEVVVLDSAGYGRVTVNKSVTIVASAGVYAGITVFSGTNGVDVLASGLAVALKGLSINGQGGLHGIYMNAPGDLAIERCEISNMAGNGLFVGTAGAKVSVRESSAKGNGFAGFAFTGASNAMLSRVHAEGNQYAGVGAYDGATVTVRDSTLAKNVKGVDALAMAGSGLSTRMLLDGVLIADNSAQGIYVNAQYSNWVYLTVTRSSIAHNGNDGALLETSDATGHVNALFSDNVFQDIDHIGVHASCSNPCWVYSFLTRNRFVGGGTSNRSEGGGQIDSSGDNVSVEPHSTPDHTGGLW